MARYIRFSPYKLRPYVNVVRGKDVSYSLHWLTVCKVKRAAPIRKLIASAVANAKNVANVEQDNLVIKEIKVDQGPVYRYFKPSARGISSVLRKRFSHIKVILERKNDK